MNSAWMNINSRNAYLDGISASLEKGLAAKEVVCSITTGFRSIPSIRTAPGLNPYHASVADIGYGFDAALGTIKRLRKNESISNVKELLVFDLDTLRISEEQLRPNFDMAVANADRDVFYLIDQSRYLNREIAETIKQAISLGKALLGLEWDAIRKRIQNIQAIPRL